MRPVTFRAYSPWPAAVALGRAQIRICKEDGGRSGALLVLAQVGHGQGLDEVKPGGLGSRSEGWGGP